MESLPGGYDLVMADPPYDSDELGKLVEALQSPRLMNAGGLLVLEHRSDDEEDYAIGRFSLEDREDIRGHWNNDTDGRRGEWLRRYIRGVSTPRIMDTLI